jgi:hypothetical protein
VAPPECDNSEKVIRNYRIKRMSVWGDRHCPLLHPPDFEFHISQKGILQSENNYCGTYHALLFFHALPVPTLVQSSLKKN